MLPPLPVDRWRVVPGGDPSVEPGRPERRRGRHRLPVGIDRRAQEAGERQARSSGFSVWQVPQKRSVRTVGLDDLAVSGVTQHRRLVRRSADASTGRLRDRIRTKVSDGGCETLIAPRRYPSTRPWRPGARCCVEMGRCRALLADARFACGTGSRSPPPVLPSTPLRLLAGRSPVRAPTGARVLWRTRSPRLVPVRRSGAPRCAGSRCRRRGRRCPRPGARSDRNQPEQPAQHANRGPSRRDERLAGAELRFRLKRRPVRLQRVAGAPERAVAGPGARVDDALAAALAVDGPRPARANGPPLARHRPRLCILHAYGCAAAIKRLARDGWELKRVSGSHHLFHRPDRPGRVIVPHPRKDLPVGTLRNIWRQAGGQWTGRP